MSFRRRKLELDTSLRSCVSSDKEMELIGFAIINLTNGNMTFYPKKKYLRLEKVVFEAYRN